MSNGQTSKGVTAAKGVKPLPEIKSDLPKGPDGPKVVPKTNAPEGDAAPKKEKKLIEGITRGRMPIAVVFLVRFGDQKGESTKALATMFGTTVGKIADIKKVSTFAYLKPDFKPTAAQKEEGTAWLKRHVGYETGVVDGLIDELDAMPEASADEAAKAEAVRVAAKGQLAKTKDGKEADAGGGNRQKPAAKDLLK